MQRFDRWRAGRWFARKVDSVAAGIAFGLAVGAALAYTVVKLGGGLYFWEIMLPGSILGMIVGFARRESAGGPSRHPAGRDLRT